MQYYQQPRQNQPPYGQPYVPPAPQPYPVRQTPQQYYVPRPQMTPEEYRRFNYQRSLKRTANSLGALMLVFFGLEIVIGIVVSLISYAAGFGESLSEGSVLYMLENGMLTSLIFFLGGVIYCLIRKVRFGEILPFDRIKGGLLAKLCVIGLSFSLMSNYVVSMLNNTFGLFGIENSGGSFDTGSEPNILLYILTVAILPAFAEEFAFRGIVMGTLRPYSEGLAILVSSATFALMHGNFVQLPFTFCCGLVFAYVDIVTNSLLPSVIVHFLNNVLAVLFDILTSYGVLNENGANMWYGVIFLVTGILSFIFIKGLVGKGDGRLLQFKRADDGILFKSKVTTVSSSPTMIAYAAVMVTYCIIVLVTGIV